MSDMSAGMVDAATLNALKWPDSALDVPPNNAVSLDVLLQALQLLASDEDRKAAAKSGWHDQTPGSVQVIKSGALQITKTGTKLVASVGGLTGLLAAVAGGITTFTTDVGEPITVALIAAAAFILSSVAIALALFVKGDLEARGAATAARHAGRAEVAASFLRATAGLPARASAADSENGSLADQFLLAASAFPTEIRAWTGANPTPQLVRAMRRNSGDGGLSVRLDDGGWVPLADISGFTSPD